MIVYFNGQFLEKTKVIISPDDRGFLFADAVYEVVRSYAGRLFEWEGHQRRLIQGLETLRIRGGKIEEFRSIAEVLIRRNGLEQGDATIYLQVSRGAAPRAHRFPEAHVLPTVYMEAKPLVPKTDLQRDGAGAILAADQRWARCDIKTVGLLANVLAQQRAAEAGVYEALLVRDGAILEGSHTNVFFVLNGKLRTAPLTNYILPGVTRQVVLDLAGKAGLAVELQPCFEDQIGKVDEVFLCGTTVEIMPIVHLDGRAVGGGTPGPLTRQLQSAFRQHVQQ